MTEIHPAFRLAMLDQEFLMGDSARGVRLMLEYQKSDEILKAHKIRSTIVVFGSARVKEHGAGNQAKWYREAMRFGEIASNKGGALGLDNEGYRDNVIATGGGPGIMEAANRGAANAGAPSIGYCITLPREEKANAYCTPDLTFRFHYFAMRKMHFAMRASALVVFPGGFGTLDELFEILTLVQTHKAPPLPIVLVDREFWDGLINFDHLAEQGMINRDDIYLFEKVNTAEEAWESLEKRGLRQKKLA
jgi:uncharacterized protein (TIGR00730 family)